MPKYFVVDDESVLDSLDDSVKSKFKPYEPEDVEGLRSKANEILSEKKKLASKLTEHEETIEKLKKDRAEGGNKDLAKLQAQLDDSEAKRKEATEAHEKLKGEVLKGKVNGEAARIAATLTKDTRRAQLLTEKIARRLAYENDKFTVLDEDGNATVSSTKELSSIIRSQYDFLVDGSQASGGGAQGGDGGAGSPKQKTRSEWKAMDSNQQSQFISDGGIVTDD